MEKNHFPVCRNFYLTIFILKVCENTAESVQVIAYFRKDFLWKCLIIMEYIFLLFHFSIKMAMALMAIGPVKKGRGGIFGLLNFSFAVIFLWFGYSTHKVV